MDESVKRRERLKALRAEAVQGEVKNTESMAMRSILANPLIETSVQESFGAQRFDFYTDPMSAFSSNKRSHVGSSVAPCAISSPNLQHPSPVSGSIPTGGLCVAFWGTEASLQLIVPGPHGLVGRSWPAGNHGERSPVTPSPFHLFHNYHSPDHRAYRGPAPYQSSFPNRSPLSSHFPSHQGTPGIWTGSGGPPTHDFPSKSSGGGNLSPCFLGAGSPSFNSGPGRVPSPASRFRGGSPNPYSGRSSSAGSGYSGRRRFGSFDHSPAEETPEKFYNKSMVEDPWRFLKPVIWRGGDQTEGLETPDSLKSWLPKSISVKKTRVSESPSQSGTGSKQSLAEYLAASFAEAVESEDVAGV